MTFTTEYILTVKSLSECFRQWRIQYLVKHLYGFSPLIIFVKSSISDVRLGSEQASAGGKPLINFPNNKAADLFANQVPIAPAYEIDNSSSYPANTTTLNQR